MGRPLTDAEIADLIARWEGTHTLEERLLAAYQRQNTCWHCDAALRPDEHPHCEDCPEHADR
jgi:hypothetical protein